MTKVFGVHVPFTAQDVPAVASQTAAKKTATASKGIAAGTASTITSAANQNTKAPVAKKVGVAVRLVNAVKNVASAIVKFLGKLLYVVSFPISFPLKKLFTLSPKQTLEREIKALDKGLVNNNGLRSMLNGLSAVEQHGIHVVVGKGEYAALPKLKKAQAWATLKHGDQYYVDLGKAALSRDVSLARAPLKIALQVRLALLQQGPVIGKVAKAV